VAAGIKFYLLKAADPLTLEALLMSRQLRTSANPIAAAVPLANFGVLAVSDEERVRHLLGGGLVRSGFNVWLAADGHEAADLQRSCRRGINVVLMDVQMPGQHGPATRWASASSSRYKGTIGRYPGRMKAWTRTDDPDRVERNATALLFARYGT
jgi:hypothetical protein